MKLYYSPGACSLADHIALHEVGATFETERVDIRTKRTATGQDFRAITPKAYVPVLVLDDGRVLTENIAILDYLASIHPRLAPAGPLGRTRMIEALAYISTEIHKSFKPFWHAAGAAEKAEARTRISDLMQLLADGMEGAYLFGDQPTVADFYLYVTLLWTRRFEIHVPHVFVGLADRLESRPSVQAALKEEGLATGAPGASAAALAPVGAGS